jgi:DNA-binding NarL/FixJ family response regulator
MRTVYGDHERFLDTYFSTFPGQYFTGDGARRDADGYYWITGRIDDVLNISGHRLGTAEIEIALVEHPAVAEAAVVGYPHDIKGQGVWAYVTLEAGPDAERRAEEGTGRHGAPGDRADRQPRCDPVGARPAQDAIRQDHAPDPEKNRRAIPTRASTPKSTDSSGLDMLSLAIPPLPTPGTMRTILIADDHPLFRDALRRAVMQVLPDAALREADSVQSLVELAGAHPHADLLLLDLNMPGAHGFSALAHVRASFPALPVVVVSAREEPALMRRAIGHGAAGFIPKSSDIATIGTALNAILDGETWLPPGTAGAHSTALDPEEEALAKRIAELTPQQYRVLSMVCTGLLNKQIAYELDVSEATIKAHMTAILRKLGAHSRTQAVLLAGRLTLEGRSAAPPPDDDDMP